MTEELRLSALIQPAFHETFRNIIDGSYTTIVEEGGRNSGKSTIISLALIYRLSSPLYPPVNALVLRKVGETLLRYFATASLKDPYGSMPRDAGFVVFGEDQFRGGVTTYSARYENTRDILSEICKSTGTGYTRQYTYYGEIYSQNWIRREMFVDAGDAATSAEVQRMAELSLAESKQLSIRIQVLPTCQWKLGVDYGVGDVVTLISPDRGQLNLQIYSAESCRRAGGDELYLDLGYECWSAPSLIRKVGKENTYRRK